jgi:hypothetical protein
MDWHMVPKLDGVAVNSKPDSVGRFPSNCTREITILAFVVALFGIIVNWRLRWLAVDDAYIQYRIASHLATNGRAWFNLNERVMVTSTPLFTFLISLCFVLLGEHALIVPAINGIALALTWALSSWLVLHSFPEIARLKLKRALLYACCFALTFGILGRSSFHQMETPFAICLFMAGVAAFASGRQIALAFFVLAALTRYEMTVCLLLYLAISLYLRKLQRDGILAAGAVALGGIAILLEQFHTVIPNTIHAKAIGYGPTPYSQIIFGLLWDGPEVKQHALFLAVCHLAVICLVISALVSMALASDSEFRDQWYIYAAFACGGLIFLGYLAARIRLSFWYKPLVTFPLGLLVLFMAIKKPRSAYPAAFFFIVVFCWGWHFWSSVPASATAEYQISPDFVEAARVQRYLAVGHALNIACPDATLLTSEIGGLGYSFKGNIVDGFGLASPDATQFPPVKSIPGQVPGGFSAGIVSLRNPDLIVTYNVFAASFLQSPLKNDYDEIQTTIFNSSERGKVPKQNPWSDATMLIFTRKNGTCRPSRQFF